ncbi:MAG: hypothetical protein OXI16_09225 [Chloroflexota bacterium]|nr:hypothetical protein [Chloroflexota bacterium]
MTTEAPTTNPYSVEERMARMEAQQEIIIELLRDRNAKFDAINDRFDALDRKFDAKIDALDKKYEAKFDAINAKFDSINAKFDSINDRFDAKFDALNHHIFLAGIGIFTIVGGGVAAYIVSLLT